MGAKAKAAKKKVVDSSDDSDDEPAPKAKAKVKAAKKAVDSDDSSDDEPAPKPKAKAAKKVVDSSDDSDDEPAPKKAKVKAKAAAVDSDDSSDDEPAPKAKSKAKKIVAESDDSDDDAVEAPQAPKKKIDTEGKTEDLTVFVGGIPFSCSEDTLKKDFSECGEIEKMNVPLNEEGKPKGIAFITFKTAEGAKDVLKFDGEEYGGRTLKVNLAGQGKGKGKDGKKGKDKGKDGKGKDGKGKDNENTVFVRGLPFGTVEDVLKKDFAECGEIESLRMPLNEEGQCKGIAFVRYTSKEGCDKAKEFDSTDYGGRTIFVSMAGEGKGDGKGKDGKDGKDKGKKGKKGKKGSEAKAKSSGAMVESTGKKVSFDDDDSDDGAPPKKKTKATAPPPADSSSDD